MLRKYASETERRGRRRYTVLVLPNHHGENWIIMINYPKNLETSATMQSPTFQVGSLHTTILNFMFFRLMIWVYITQAYQITKNNNNKGKIYKKKALKIWDNKERSTKQCSSLEYFAQQIGILYDPIPSILFSPKHRSIVPENPNNKY